MARHRHKRDLRWRSRTGDGPYIPPDIENSIQLLQVIQTGVATYHQVVLITYPKSAKTPYWSVNTPDLTHSVRPQHMLLLVERNLVLFYNMSPNEFLTQYALGTLEGRVIIGVETNQLELEV